MRHVIHRARSCHAVVDDRQHPVVHDRMITFIRQSKAVQIESDILPFRHSNITRDICRKLNYITLPCIIDCRLERIRIPGRDRRRGNPLRRQRQKQQRDRHAYGGHSRQHGQRNFFDVFHKLPPIWHNVHSKAEK